jgi:hypothetical protein
MIIVLHVTIALAGIAFTTVTFFIPSVAKLRIASGLLVATLASGTYLTWSSHSRLLEACMMGLLYTAGVSYGIYAAQRKLTAVSVREK